MGYVEGVEDEEKGEDGGVDVEKPAGLLPFQVDKRRNHRVTDQPCVRISLLPFTTGGPQVKQLLHNPSLPWRALLENAPKVNLSAKVQTILCGSDSLHVFIQLLFHNPIPVDRVVKQLPQNRPRRLALLLDDPAPQVDLPLVEDLVDLAMVAALQTLLHRSDDVIGNLDWIFFIRKLSFAMTQKQLCDIHALSLNFQCRRYFTTPVFSRPISIPVLNHFHGQS